LPIQHGVIQLSKEKHIIHQYNLIVLRTIYDLILLHIGFVITQVLFGVASILLG